VLRKPWLNQVNSCSTPKDFARVMVVLMSCIKPVVYAPVWHEQLGKHTYLYIFLHIIFAIYSLTVLGHVKLYRITHAEREEKKKTDKKDKKDKDAEEDERNKLTIHFVKYTLGLKHQVSNNIVYLILSVLLSTFRARFTNKKEKNIEFMVNGGGSGYQKQETINWPILQNKD